MEANEMEAGTRDEGGQALQEFKRCHDDMRSAIAVGGFELQDDVAFLSASQPFVAQGGTADVATEIVIVTLHMADEVDLDYRLYPIQRLVDRGEISGGFGQRGSGIHGMSAAGCTVGPQHTASLLVAKPHAKARSRAPPLA